MRAIVKLLIAPLMLAAVACGGEKDETVQLDPGLSNDLQMAAQVQAYPPQQFMSPYEMGYAPSPYGPQPYPAPYGVQQPYQVANRGGYYPAPQPVAQRAPRASTGTIRRAEPIRNTKRDAILGAAAGAAIGAVSSRDRLKGAVIGAAAGGILGGIIGHTIDVERP